MRTCLYDLSKSGIDPEQLKVAQQLSGMFPKDRQVYMVVNRSSFYLLSEVDHSALLDEALRIPGGKRDLATHTHLLRDFRIDEQDFSEWFDRIAG